MRSVTNSLTRPLNTLSTLNMKFNLTLRSRNILHLAKLPIMKCKQKVGVSRTSDDTMLIHKWGIIYREGKGGVSTFLIEKAVC